MTETMCGVPFGCDWLPLYLSISDPVRDPSLLIADRRDERVMVDSDRPSSLDLSA